MNDNILDGFENWTPLMELSLSSFPDKLYGIYVFTLNEIIEYPKGNSKILYIGQTSNYWMRFFRNYIGGVGGSTTKRIHGYLFDDEYVEKVNVGFKVCEDYKSEEKRLRNLFREIFGANPKWNLI